MIDIQEHGGKFGGSGFLFHGEYRETKLKDDVKGGDLVRVGTEFQSIPIPEGVYGEISHTYFSPGGKYALIRSGTERRAGLYERVYVGDNIEYRKLPNPIGFTTQLWDLNTVIWNNRENLFIILNNNREYGTFQLTNGVWTKITFSVAGTTVFNDGVFSPDDEYLVMKSGSSTSSIRGITVLKVSGLNSRATFSVHYPHNDVPNLDWSYRPYFTTNRVFTVLRGGTQTVATITTTSMTMASYSMGQNTNHYAFLRDGEYLFTTDGQGRNDLYRKNSNNSYTRIPDAVTYIYPSDLGTSGFGTMFPSKDTDDVVMYANFGRAIKFRLDAVDEKFTRITGFHPDGIGDIRFPTISNSMPPNTVDRVFLVEEARTGRLMAERIVGYKFDQDDQYNQEFIGIAKKSGKAGDKINVVKITN